MDAFFFCALTYAHAHAHVYTHTHKYSAFLCYEIAEISTMTVNHSIDHQAAFTKIWIKMGTNFKHKMQNNSESAKH